MYKSVLTVVKFHGVAIEIQLINFLVYKVVETTSRYGCWLLEIASCFDNNWLSTGIYLYLLLLRLLEKNCKTKEVRIEDEWTSTFVYHLWKWWILKMNKITSIPCLARTLGQKPICLGAKVFHIIKSWKRKILFVLWFCLFY